MAFLNSGTILHPILSKSQCWCVDGVSKFVLRIRASSYYRVELPHVSEGEKKQVEHFKKVLDQVLQYEKTPCPFKRGFTVDLPEPPLRPMLKKPWRPKQREARLAEGFALLPENSGGPMAIEDDDTNQVQQKDDMGSDTGLESWQVTEVADFPLESSDISSIASTQSRNDSEADSYSKFMKDDLLQEVHTQPYHPKTSTKPNRVVTERTITAPPQLTRISSAASPTSHSDAVSTSNKQHSSSISSSVDSFHSFHSPISPLPPSPLSSHPDSTDSTMSMNNIRGHERVESETTVTSSARVMWNLKNEEVESSSDRPRTPALANDVASQDDLWDEIKTPSPPGLRVRRSLRKRRARSPLPPSQNLYSPCSPKDNLSSQHFTAAIIQQSCSFLLGPPLHLVAVMLRIAAKLLRGAFPASNLESRRGGERIPCSWEFSSDGSDGSEELWEEDDYGVSLGKTLSGKDVTTKDIGASWEID